MRELTGKQREVLGFMRNFHARHGVPPTVREIAARFGVTPRAAFDHLRALEREHHIAVAIFGFQNEREQVVADVDFLEPL